MGQLAVDFTESQQKLAERSLDEAMQEILDAQPASQNGQVKATKFRSIQLAEFFAICELFYDTAPELRVSDSILLLWHLTLLVGTDVSLMAYDINFTECNRVVLCCIVLRWVTVLAIGGHLVLREAIHARWLLRALAGRQRRGGDAFGCRFRGDEDVDVDIELLVTCRGVGNMLS